MAHVQKTDDGVFNHPGMILQTVADHATAKALGLYAMQT